MYNIEVESFSSRDKIEIARDYLIPRTMTKFGMDRGTINFTDDVINHIISITPKESGVRNLIRSLENIVSRLNIIRMVDTVDASSSIVRKMFSVKINTFTIDVTKEMVDHLISTDRARPRVNTIDAMYL
jgi:ATP-dependent Lon protease